MQKTYDFVGGRKIFFVYLCFFSNLTLAMCGKYDDRFANYCNILVATYIVGNVAYKKVEK